MEFLFKEDGKLITYQEDNFNWSVREREWHIIKVPCTNEQAQSIISQIGGIVEDPMVDIPIIKYAYIDNFDNIENLDFSTFSSRLIYKE